MRLLLVIAMVLAQVSVSWGATHEVPSQFPTINAAMDVASPGDTVLVAPGTYTDAEVRQVGPFTIAAAVFLADGVTLLSEAGPQATVLDLQGQDFGAPNTRLVYAEGLISLSSILGFTMTGTPPGNCAIRIDQCESVAIRDCVIRDIDATGFAGGGVYCLFTYHLELTNCEFINCVGDFGGGCRIIGPSVDMAGCVFRSGTGGGVVILQDSFFPPQEIAVRDCEFIGNTGGAGLGIVGDLSTVVVDRCAFEDNQSTFGGAGLIVGALDYSVTKCVFWSNQCLGTARGGGARLASYGTGSVERNTFHENGQESFSLGGAALNLGGINGSTTTMSNNIVSGSTGDGAISISDTELTSSCNVFWDNAEGLGPDYVLDPTDREVDPLFCDPANGDFTLHVESPCLAANSGGCGDIGAHGMGCGTISVRASSWAEIKGRYLE